MQLLLEEFGKWVKNGTAANEVQRDAFYTLVYDALQMVCNLFAALHAAHGPIVSEMTKTLLRIQNLLSSLESDGCMSLPQETQMQQ